MNTSRDIGNNVNARCDMNNNYKASIERNVNMLMRNDREHYQKLQFIIFLSAGLTLRSLAPNYHVIQLTLNKWYEAP